jgi:hypothetical protein
VRNGFDGTNNFLNRKEFRDNCKIESFFKNLNSRESSSHEDKLMTPGGREEEKFWGTGRI